MDTHNTKHLKIIELNVNSIRTKCRRANLQLFLDEHKPHIVLLCETRLNAIHTVHFKNYNIIRTDRCSGTGGGTAILIRHGIKFHEFNITSLNLSAIECTAVIIPTINKKIAILSIYSVQDSLDKNDLKKIFRHFHDHSVIVGGDFNAKHQNWLNTHRNHSGSVLYNWMNEFEQMTKVRLLHTLHPTFHQTTCHSFLDLFIITNDLIIKAEPHLQGCLKTVDYESDHCGVVLIIELNGSILKTEPTQIRSFTKVDWKKFNSKLDNGIGNISLPENKVLSSVEIESALESLNTLIFDTIENVIPKVSVLNPLLPPLPPETLALIKHKKTLRHRWRNHGYRHDDYQIRSEITCLSKIIKDRVKRHHTELWENRLKTVKLNNDTFKNIRALSGGHRKAAFSPELINPQTNLRETDNCEKANILGAHFEAVHLKNQRLGDPVFTEEAEVLSTQILHNRFAPRFSFTQHQPANPSVGFFADRHLVSITSLKSIITSRANKKSCGPDCIPNIVIRKFSSNTIRFLATLFNHCYNIAYFPIAWKKAHVIPILKKDKPPEHVNSYRPIALLSCISKLYECALKEVIVQHCDTHHILPDSQFGFRRGYSTTDALAKFQHDIATNINNKRVTIACSLDNEKAFDTLWIAGLIFKMKNLLNFEDHICRSILEYLSHRSFVVCVNKSQSSSYNIAAGVPQGGVLSALLYIIYTSDIPRPESHQQPVQTIMYADDVLVYVSTSFLQGGQNRINEYLARLSRYLNHWKISINPSKSEAIVIRGTAKYCTKSAMKYRNNVKLVLNGTQIPLSSSIKYLGVIFQTNNSFVQHAATIRSKTLRCFHSLYGILKATAKLSISVKLLIYKQLLRPILAYGFTAWSSITSAQMENIRALERRCLRACINYRRAPGSHHLRIERIYEAANIEWIDHFLVRTALRALDKMVISDNTLLSSMASYDEEELTNSKYKPPIHLRFLRDNNQLYRGSILLHYHRRANRTSSTNPLVYRY